jgi:hypothetical protein
VGGSREFQDVHVGAGSSEQCVQVGQALGIAEVGGGAPVADAPEFAVATQFSGRLVR